MSRWLGPDYITRDGLTSLADTCTVHAVKIEVDSPAEYPAWLHVERSCADYHLDLDSTLTPSGATGGTYTWSKEVGAGGGCRVRGEIGFVRVCLGLFCPAAPGVQSGVSYYYV